MPHGRDGLNKRAGRKSPPPDPFEEDVLALIPALRRYSRSLARSDTDGEDLLQDCVEKCLQDRAHGEAVNLRAWVFTIMTNLYRNGRRRQRSAPEVELDETLGLRARKTMRILWSGSVCCAHSSALCGQSRRF